MPDSLTNEVTTLPIAAITAWMLINSSHSTVQPLNDKEKAVLIQEMVGIVISDT